LLQRLRELDAAELGTIDWAAAAGANRTASPVGASSPCTS
jgi:hypothetical protein